MKNQKIKEGYRIVWRYKETKQYVSAYVREVHDDLILIRNGDFGAFIWLNLNDVVVKILKE